MIARNLKLYPNSIRVARKLVPRTGFEFSPVQKVVLPEKLSDALLMWADNCEKLAEVLELIPDHLHNQRHWTRPTANECGTTGCALGWAALSGQIPGLQYTYRDYSGLDDTAVSRTLVPLSSGEPLGWMVAGTHHFGDAVFKGIFMKTHLSKEKVVYLLRFQANRYRKAAKAPAAKRKRVVYDSVLTL